MKPTMLYIVFLLFLVSCHLDNKIIITPIDLELDYPPTDRMKYYEVSNYEQSSKENLLEILENYVQLNCMESEIKQYESYFLSFYKKSYWVDYRPYIANKRQEQAEFPVIAEQKNKNIALIYYRKLNEHNDRWLYARILYDNDFIVLTKTDTILLSRKETLQYKCKISNEIGGINWGNRDGKSGKDFLKSEKIERYENCPKSGKK